MFVETIIDDGLRPALVKTLAFQEERLRMIAENIANAQTPGFRAKQLDVAGFQHSLRRAMEERKAGESIFVVENEKEVRTDEQGFLEVIPSEAPAETVLFHDGTNVSLEQQMAELAQTGLWNDLAGRLLHNSYEGLRKAIRGTA